MNQYVERICEAAKTFFEHEPVQIMLFGSWARGTQHRSSDVDVAIDYKEGESNRQKIDEFRDFLEELTIPYSVDIVDMHEASKALQEEIRKDGIVWKE